MSMTTLCKNAIKLFLLRRIIRRNSNLFIELPVDIRRRDLMQIGLGKLYLGEKSIVKGRIVAEHKDAVVRIGRCVFIGAGTRIAAANSIEIEDNVLISHNVYITDNDGHSKKVESRRTDVPNRWLGVKNWEDVASSPVRIGAGAWIGPNCVVLKGCSIGENSIVAAGTVVLRDVPPNTLAYEKRPLIYKSLRSSCGEV